MVRHRKENNPRICATDPRRSFFRCTADRQSKLAPREISDPFLPAGEPHKRIVEIAHKATNRKLDALKPSLDVSVCLPFSRSNTTSGRLRLMLSTKP